mmetsp:Transcript_30952/g.42897  ORF Transcript_30952/g.42897 Transcript_30952/m.42897 type:complete len:282 (-) Transcript_30952:49-894(-)
MDDIGSIPKCFIEPHVNRVSSETPIKLYADSGDKVVSEFWAGKYEKDAQRNWDIFYKNNQEKFFKDRHYLLQEFPELTPDPSMSSLSVLELGCGPGNTVYPLVESDPRVKVHCCDFSPRAVGLVKQHQQYDPARVNAFQCDITHNNLTDNIEEQSVDIVLCIFVLSAIAPEKMPDAVRNLAQVLRKSKGSRVFLRDYAVGDLAQERFDKKTNRQKISENFYVRGDGTRSYFFSESFLKNLFESEGFETLDIKIHEREIENRATNLKMDRQWIQGHFCLKEP